MGNPDVLTGESALLQELNEIASRRRLRGSCSPPDNRVDLPESSNQRAARLKLSALCLSGGGIRSASFCLGVLQALASRRLLTQFDYLSTVSGGGFIGGWLQVLVRECGGVSAAEAALTEPRPMPVRRLRAYTNYLTPQTGALSADTWAALILYLRNLLINWLTFTPLFLLVALAPIAYRTGISVLSSAAMLDLILLAVATMLLLGAVVNGSMMLPSHRPTDGESGAPDYVSARRIQYAVIVPALAWAATIPVLLDFAAGEPDSGGGVQRTAMMHHVAWLVPSAYLAAVIAGYQIGWTLQTWRVDRALLLFKANFMRWVTASVATAAMTWLVINIALAVLPLRLQGGTKPVLVDTATVLTVFGPLTFGGLHVLHTALFVALRHESELSDLDREWLGRINAMILRVAVLWAVFSLACIVLSVAASVLQQAAPGRISGANQVGMSLLGTVTVLVGGVSAWLGKIWPSVEQLGSRVGLWDRVRAYAPAALGLLFAIALLAVLGGVLQTGLGQAQLAILGWPSAQQLQQSPQWLPLALQGLLTVFLLLMITAFRRVNVNRFSMHAVYRNRLSRAFLGSARGRRRQDPFTGFDPQDSPPLASLLRSGSSLFPVINMTLNITAGSNTALAERRAASFTATPLHCGAATLRHPMQRETGQDPAGAFVATTHFAGLETLDASWRRNTETGPALGTMLTVSGAAMSPNWGYHSSPITAFMMTLFNVRLGMWLPNPSKATPRELALARPPHALRALLDEMLGRTTDDRDAIYLSDGGHFENLGVYEMMRRRCAMIVVVDAGQDPTCALFDLGSAIRKAEIDFGARVAMQEPMQLYSRRRLETEPAPTPAAMDFAVGRISYGEGHEGCLLYLKPSFLATIPAEVRAYGAMHSEFPHESTADQWFTESQFESYRMLGEHQMRQLLTAVKEGDLAGLLRAAERTGTT